MSCDCEIEITDASQAKTLWILLGLNSGMFLLEFLVGIYSDSTGLIADSLDMLADAVVYGIGLYAIGKAAEKKIHAATLSGWFQILLAFGVLTEVIRKFIYGSEPLSDWMIGMGLLALAVNVICLMLIAKHRHGEVHMRASWIFSANDVLANLGVIISGFLVALFASNLPDLIIGLFITLLVLSGGIRILKEAKGEASTLQNVACTETACKTESCCEEKS